MEAVRFVWNTLVSHGLRWARALPGFVHSIAFPFSATVGISDGRNAHRSVVYVHTSTTTTALNGVQKSLEKEKNEA